MHDDIRNGCVVKENQHDLQQPMNPWTDPETQQDWTHISVLQAKTLSAVSCSAGFTQKC